MNLTQIKAEIERIIAATPYSKEEVLTYLNAEPDLSPNELFAYGIALEYLKEKKNGDHKKLIRQFTKKKNALMKEYL